MTKESLMRLRTRHPRLCAAACKVYGLAIHLYPAELRRGFRDELIVTFRNRLEDVLNRGSVVDWCAFAGHITFDWMRTLCLHPTELRTDDSASILGLREGDTAIGSADMALGSSLVFASAGFFLACAGWYTYLAILPRYVRP